VVDVRSRRPTMRAQYSRFVVALPFSVLGFFVYATGHLHRREKPFHVRGGSSIISGASIAEDIYLSSDYVLYPYP